MGRPTTLELTDIGGVGADYAALLRAAGVEGCGDLAGRDAVELFERMASVNDTRYLVRRLPNIEMTTRWVAEAGTIGERP